MGSHHGSFCQQAPGKEAVRAHFPAGDTQASFVPTRTGGGVKEAIRIRTVSKKYMYTFTQPYISKWSGAKGHKKLAGIVPTRLQTSCHYKDDKVIALIVLCGFSLRLLSSPPSLVLTHTFSLHESETWW